MSEDHQSLVDRVSDWLAKEGYPLEFSAASQLRAAGFHVRQGEYVRDPKGGVPRETDVTAALTVTVSGSLLRVYQLIECKWSKDKPWVVFAGPGGMVQSAMIAQSIGSVTARSLLWARAGDPHLQSLSLFDAPRTPAFGGRQAFSDKNDVFYSTLQGVVSKASLLAEGYDENTKKIDQSLEKAVVVFPVVVVDGVLMGATYEGEDRRLCLKEVPQVRIHWRGAASWRLHATVDIVAASALPTFAAQRFLDSKIFLQQLGVGFEQLHQCWKMKTFKPLEITNGARGVIGKPALLREMKASFPEPRKELPEAGA